mmetsp:Transcript_5669/g.13505  ORF Transcript_5669/g.13505 Transcript_5669/m.13505 type:complete len:208 (-) Transcript_5669:8-631(-)
MHSETCWWASSSSLRSRSSASWKASWTASCGGRLARRSSLLSVTLRLFHSAALALWRSSVHCPTRKEACSMLSIFWLSALAMFCSLAARRFNLSSRARVLLPQGRGRPASSGAASSCLLFFSSCRSALTQLRCESVCASHAALSFRTERSSLPRPSVPRGLRPSKSVMPFEGRRQQAYSYSTWHLKRLASGRQNLPPPPSNVQNASA